MAKPTPASETPGSGNTFKALGIPQPEMAKTKSDIALAIYRTLQDKELSQKEAASIMGVDQAKVSAISRGITKGYSIDRLLTFLNRLDVDVDIRLTPKTRKNEQGHTKVVGLA